MKKKTALTKMHIAPSTVCYDAVAARDSNEVGLILAAVRKRNGYSLVTFSELLRHYGVDVSDKGISKWEKGYTTPSIYQLVAICHALNIKEGPSYFTKTFQKPALLNAIGQKKVAEYEMDLIASRRYQPGTEEPAKIDCIMMPVSELPVSAGQELFLRVKCSSRYRCLPVAFRQGLSLGYTLVAIVWSRVIMTDKSYG